MKILRAFGKTVIIVIIPIVIGLLGNIIAPDLTEKIKVSYPNYFVLLSIFIFILAIIAFIWSMIEEMRNEKRAKVQEGNIVIAQRGKRIGKDAKVIGMETKGEIPSVGINQEFDTVEGEMTGLKAQGKKRNK